MSRRHAILTSLSTLLCLGLSGCATELATGEMPEVVDVSSLSAHYLRVRFSKPAGPPAEQPANYIVTGPDGQQLPVHDVQLDSQRTEAILTTDQQQPVQYRLGMSTFAPLLSGQALPIGALGFVGTSTLEPFLESAVSLSDTQVLLTFSAQMDRATAENVLHYEIADPDGNTDIDIRITGATLEPDATTVILTTTPQNNIEYLVRVTNVQRRFSCQDGGRIFLDDATQGSVCAGNYRPVNPDGTLTEFVLTGRTSIDRNSELNPDATGTGGSVNLSASGAGIKRAECNADHDGIDGGNGADPDEELIFTPDRAELAENIVIGVRDLQFGDNEPILFISSDTAAGYDYVVGSAEIEAAFNTGADTGDIVFANLVSLPSGLMVDSIKLRETGDVLWVHSICGLSVGRRLIDPTRNIAVFFGIPPVDTDGPRVISAESTNNTTVVVSFSEPLGSAAADPLHFNISPDLRITAAVLTRYDTQVILTTLPQLVDVDYTVTVSNVRDKAGNLINALFDSAMFSFAGGPASLGSEVLPRVIGAASTSNTTVLVTFSKPMGDSALVAGHYVVVQENVNTEAGVLLVLSDPVPQFLGVDRTAVELNTASQSDITYAVAVTNVQDLFGNQLAPQSILVDPTSASFAGTPFGCPAQICTNSGDGCAGDADCDDDPPCNPGEADCEGTCVQPACSLPDSDGDGVLDSVEQRGYVVIVRHSNGTTTERQVTSDPFTPDTDYDGVSDAKEKRLGSDPRNPDTDADQLPDIEEFGRVFSSLTNQDTDGDGISDQSEVNFFKTNANLADSDGDGFDDAQELYQMNSDPRIANLPTPDISVRSVNLQIDEQFTFVDEQGTVRSTDSNSSSTLTASQTNKVSSSITTTIGIAGKVGGEVKFDKLGAFDGASISGEASISAGLAFQASRESTQEAVSVFQQSMSKGFAVTGSRSSSRQIQGGRVDALVTLNNAGDVAFSLNDLEITVSAPDPIDRTSFVPVATLIPNSTLITGDPAQFNIGVLGASVGPILFSSRDVFPNLVEDLMRDPRGLLIEFANFNLTDEFGRNFAYSSQAARDRTVGLMIDFGDGNPESFLVAYAPVRFANSSCNPVAVPGCDIVGGFAGFADGMIPPFGGVGPLPGLPLEYILEEVLQMRRSTISDLPPVWELTEADLPLDEVHEVDGNDIPVAPDAILVGLNNVSDSIAQGDDVQLIPYGIDGLPEDAIVITAGENGVLESTVDPGDKDAVVTGYATTKTCGPLTPSSIRPGPNGIVETLRDPFSDDMQEELPGIVDLALDTDVILPGSNGFIDTAPAGDDVFVGPGVPCDSADDCPGAGLCDGQETLFRLKQRTRGQFGRVWAVLVPDDNLIGLDFRKIILRPGETLNLGFIQDLDRDGLISDVEFLFGSSDTRQDTDGDQLDDFSEVRIGWEVGVDGQPLRRVFPDPRLADSDGDGLSDGEEQDFRRVQCECVGGLDAGEACTRNIDMSQDEELEACRAGTHPQTDPGTCQNVADRDLGRFACSPNVSANRLDPRRRDTDGDDVTDGDEVLGWLTQAAVIDPKQVVRAGPNRRADSAACPADLCAGGRSDGESCRFDRDCQALKVCTGGLNQGQACANDIECQGPTPLRSGLCEEAVLCSNLPADVASTPPCTTNADCLAGESCEDLSCPNMPPVNRCITPFGGVCNRPYLCSDGSACTLGGPACADASECRTCDDVQVVDVGTVGLDEYAVVVAPGQDGVLDAPAAVPGPPGPDMAADDVTVAAGDLHAETTAQGDDQQIALVDDNFVLVDTPLGRTIVRPGINGILDSLPNNADDRDGVLGDAKNVLALGQYVQITNPLKPDTDQDQIRDGFERLLGSDPRNAADGGLLADTDGDGLTDQQEQDIGWIVRVAGQPDETVYSNPNVPDSDMDGLPDLVENILRSNPMVEDSDADGLTDFDELSAERFADFEIFNELFLGFLIDGSSSQMYGTDLLNCDTDGDHLSDGFELLEGFSVTVPSADGGMESRQAFTDPLNADTDFDGLSDGAEFSLNPPTDPNDFDSDDDGRTDGQECTPCSPSANCLVSGCDTPATELAACASDPLVPEKFVTIRYASFRIMQASDFNGAGDYRWQFAVQKSDTAAVSVLASYNADQCENCGECGAGSPSDRCDTEDVGNPDDCRQCTIPAGVAIDLCCRRTCEAPFILTPGQGLLLFGEVTEHETSCVPDDYLTYHKTLSYENVQTGYTAEVVTLYDEGPDGDLILELIVEITVE